MRWTAGFQAGREYGEDAGEAASRVWELGLDWMRGADREALVQAVAEGSTQEWWPKAFFPAEVPGDEARDEVRDELDFDPEPVFSAVSVPTLLFYGDQDEWIPVPESIATWRRALGDKAELLVIEGVGHEPAVDEAVSPLYEQTMLDWLRRVAR
jgi:pimeloyl-ACP methyl ester carboxylesterase